LIPKRSAATRASIIATKVRSPLHRLTPARTPLGRFGKPDDIARGCVDFASGESAYVSGAELVICGDATAS